MGRAPITVDRVMSMFGASQMSRSSAGCGRPSAAHRCGLGHGSRRRGVKAVGHGSSLPRRRVRVGARRLRCRLDAGRGGPAGAVARRPRGARITRPGAAAHAGDGQGAEVAAGVLHARAPSPGPPSAGMGWPSSQPCARSQPAARTIRRCSGVSTPSATERMPSVRVSPTIAASTAPVSPADGLLGGVEQRAVDLQRADRQREQLRERGPAGAEVVDRPRGRRSCAAPSAGPRRGSGPRPRWSRSARAPAGRAAGRSRAAPPARRGRGSRPRSAGR